MLCPLSYGADENQSTNLASLRPTYVRLLQCLSLILPRRFVHTSLSMLGGSGDSAKFATALEAAGLSGPS